MRDEKMKKMSDPIESGRLPSELEEDFIEAMMPAATISDALQTYLDASPQDAEVLASYRGLADDFHADVNNIDPGDHFFESLQDEIVSAIAAPPRPVVEAPEPGSASLLERALSLLTPARAIAAIAIAMALVLAFFLVGGDALMPTGDPGPLVAEKPKSPHLKTNLTNEEVRELEQIASRFDLNLDDWDEDSEAPIGSLELTEQELESIEESLVEL